MEYYSVHDRIISTTACVHTNPVIRLAHIPGLQVALQSCHRNTTREEEEDRDICVDGQRHVEL